ncbi:MAG: SRPBCC domain-containing protein [Paludibacterium sp.]|uniref:SRPBCC family protein n=1 Tax=Paludibacterium sp. TaxID=1917523 RepID=UPI0025EFB208|nr:SRPBCC domain-containing protein [Paludibacterium sp.]MBV8046701.1 SRPBCC domain-containing protein [Paludibacterium sp.]MBV8647294.1 SRPBCC domain-containing protein [Paludibacterium sp.]
MQRSHTLASTARSLVFERLMPHPPEKIWRALTQSWLMKEWLMENDFVAEVGHRFTVRAAPLPGWSGVTHCEVVTVDAPRRLAYRWGDGTESVNHLVTLVTWTLVPQNDGTLVRMEQSGFGPDDGHSYERMGGRWPDMLARLEHVTGGAETNG